jgi:hypothetical protein
MSLSSDTAMDAAATEKRLRGEVVYFHAVDFAYDMERSLALKTLLGSPLVPFQVDSRKRSPRGHAFFRPLTATPPSLKRQLAGKEVVIAYSIKLLPVGALSITVRMPFCVSSVTELFTLQDPVFDDGSRLFDLIQRLAEQARIELLPHSIRPHAVLPEGESYRVFCIDTDSSEVGRNPANWMENHQAALAALLAGEPSGAPLSEQEINASLDHSLSYYQHDLFVTDWDAALVVDERQDFAESLYVLELANVQLEELDAYDRHLDAALERAYRDIGGRRGPRRARILPELRELRIDLARFSDELSNITKFFGEWHLARVYEQTARVFHLAEWNRAIDEKLKTLDSLYEMLKQDQNHRLMVWLEVAIVLLFILDVVMLFAGGK